MCTAFVIGLDGCQGQAQNRYFLLLFSTLVDSWKLISTCWKFALAHQIVADETCQKIKIKNCRWELDQFATPSLIRIGWKMLSWNWDPLIACINQFLAITLEREGDGSYNGQRMGELYKLWTLEQLELIFLFLLGN